ncbi:MAG TPA: PilN domain-containing protein [Gemmatimonadaceae bacterium]|nr:PilN domain-containing protein [Gemmatimonadaceae bacterium]
MIEVNLLPGAKKSKRSGGGGGKSIDFAAIGAAISSKVKDKYLAAAVGTAAVAIAAIALMFTTQRARESSLRAEEARQVQDSTEYAVVLADRMRAQARRDSALLQLMIIRAIDGERFIWPHIMEEVSRAIPTYTWLTSLAINGTAQGLNPAASIKTPPPDTGRVRRPRRDPVIPRDTVRIAMVGRTVDLQALTRFYRNLEDSPFLEGVTLRQSIPAIQNGKDIYQFTLDLMFTRPDSLLIRRVPFTATEGR